MVTMLHAVLALQWQATFLVHKKHYGLGCFKSILGCMYRPINDTKEIRFLFLAQS